MTKVFATGCTGYIGGDALYALVHAHPEYDITCLVRNSDKGATIVSSYPKIRLVYGDLDSYALVSEEAAKADIVCNWASADHVRGAEALTQGLSTRPSSRPGFLIHTSGTGILEIDDIQRGTYGIASTKVYDDFDNVSEVTSLPKDAPHREVDMVVLAAGTAHADNIKTAIVAPPTIYGEGRGPDSKRSIQLPELSRCTLELGHGIQVEGGKAMWTQIHVYDLSRLYVRLIEEAAAGGGKATWGAEGYYFAENGDFMWGDIAAKAAQVAHQKGWIKTAEVKSMSPTEVEAIQKAGSYLWGMNSRCRAVRGRKLLGWKPVEKSLVEEIPRALEIEARRMGLVQGHAAEAAGEA